MARILIVEDDADLRPALAEFLGLMGHEVLVAHDGRSALDHARSDGIDVIVLDWQLDDEPSGVALLSALRSLSRASVAVMSGNPLAILEATEAKANAYIRKPFGLGELNRLILLLAQRRAP